MAFDVLKKRSLSKNIPRERLFHGYKKCFGSKTFRKSVRRERLRKRQSAWGTSVHLVRNQSGPGLCKVQKEAPVSKTAELTDNETCVCANIWYRHLTSSTALAIVMLLCIWQDRVPIDSERGICARRKKMIVSNMNAVVHSGKEAAYKNCSGLRGQKLDDPTLQLHILRYCIAKPRWLATVQQRTKFTLYNVKQPEPKFRTPNLVSGSLPPWCCSFSLCNR